MIRTCGPFDYAGILQEKLEKGVFLTTAFGDKRNTMVIGWGGINVIWNRPMMVVFVRKIRATHELLEQSGQFTVSVPLSRDLSAALKICGTRSMRDIDKFAVCHLTPVPGRKVMTPVIGECELHYECRIMYKQQLSQSDIPDVVKTRFYPTGANHTVYFAEIVDSYVFEEEK
jgi:flavin reductase (DIM6/NTAB) family NADH-FMN oxidoreductase RutF